MAEISSDHDWFLTGFFIYFFGGFKPSFKSC